MAEVDEATAAGCQCPRTPGHGCKRPLTQEDLPCDVCRAGCVTLRSTWEGVTEVLGAHLGVSGWAMEEPG